MPNFVVVSLEREQIFFKKKGTDKTKEKFAASHRQYSS